MGSLAIYPQSAMYAHGGFWLFFPRGYYLYIDEEIGACWEVRVGKLADEASLDDFVVQDKKVLFHSVSMDAISAISDAMAFGLKNGYFVFNWEDNLRPPCEVIVEKNIINGAFIVRSLGKLTKRGIVAEITRKKTGTVTAKTFVYVPGEENYNLGLLENTGQVCFILGTAAPQEQIVGNGGAIADWTGLVQTYCREAFQPRCVQYYLYNGRRLEGFMRAASADQVYLRHKAILEPMRYFDGQFEPDYRTLHVDYVGGKIGRFLVPLIRRVLQNAIWLGYSKISLYCANERLASLLQQRWQFKVTRTIQSTVEVQFLERRLQEYIVRASAAEICVQDDDAS